MSATRQADILRQLESSCASDGELLARFAASRDPGAFEELVRRHGALVLGVCRRVTGHPQDAEDAFQVAFLVLAQKAGLLRVTGRLGNWLYGVAYRVSLRARRAAGRRKAREVTMSNPPEVAAPPSGAVQPELLSVLDAELAALPAHYRDAIVLCDLQGASREDAATALGVPEGTLSSRLANGRRKLAARLTKHGVALSVATVSLALVEARGGTVVPAELVSRTGQLAADVAAGGAVPRALAHLLNGGSAVRKMLVISAALVAVATGAVLAARPGAELPPNNLPKTPVAVTEKVAEQPKPKAESKAKPEEPIGFTTAPRLRHAVDLPFGEPDAALWNPSGTRLAVTGARARGGVDKKSGAAVVLCEPGNASLVEGDLDGGDYLAGFAPDGERFVTALHEDHLISGRHHLDLWSPTTPPEVPKLWSPAMPPEAPKKLKQVLIHSTRVPLDAMAVGRYAFALDLKGFRVVAWERGTTADPTKLEVREYGAADGKLLKTLIKLDYAPHALAANGKRFAALSKDQSKVAVYDVDSGAMLREVLLPRVVKPAKTRAEPRLMFSPDATRLFVCSGIGQIVMLNADTGAELPELEGTKELSAFPSQDCFTVNGRLFAAECEVYRSEASPDRQELAARYNGRVLAVWDTQTGKVLKTWKLHSGFAALCPTKPLLAILEPNGTSATRLGFWDFSAEVEKK